MIVLDTCAILWIVDGSDTISADVRARIDAEPIVAVSAISAFEVALKYRGGKLRLPFSPEEWWRRVVEHHHLDVINLDDTVAMRATTLPPIHRDRADRFIIATAHAYNAPVVTSDSRFHAYGVTVIL